ncbi:lasso RiPP family leader peptide-containing protein [Streptomyces sp. NPDC046261]
MELRTDTRAGRGQDADEYDAPELVEVGGFAELTLGAGTDEPELALYLGD